MVIDCHGKREYYDIRRALPPTIDECLGTLDPIGGLIYFRHWTKEVIRMWK